MKRTEARGVTTFGALVALFAAFGGFGCLCSIGGHRCGGDDFDLVAIEGPADASDAGDAGDASDAAANAD